jgi:hypothetical protein
MKNNKTLGLSVRFWTNSIENLEAEGRKRTACWDSGMVALEANREKQLMATTEPFDNIEDIPKAIKAVLRRSKILVVSDCKRGRRRL